MIVFKPSLAMEFHRFFIFFLILNVSCRHLCLWNNKSCSTRATDWQTSLFSQICTPALRLFKRTRNGVGARPWPPGGHLSFPLCVVSAFFCSMHSTKVSKKQNTWSRSRAPVSQNKDLAQPPCRCRLPHLHQSHELQQAGQQALHPRRMTHWSG